MATPLAQLLGSARLIGRGIDAGLSSLAEADAPHNALSTKQHALRSALNGVYGDHLTQSANPLAIDMQLISGGNPVDLHHRAQYGWTQVLGKIVFLGTPHQPDAFQ